MHRLVAMMLLSLAMHARAGAAGRLELPAFPLPALVHEAGATVEVTPTRLLRELHRSGVHGLDDLETMDADYGLLRHDSLGVLAAWLEAACRAVGFELTAARRQPYDGTALARLLTVATGLASLQKEEQPLAVPIGTLVCERRAAWGELPGDGAQDAYVIFATEAGMVVYDPPTRQLTPLAEFPNREKIVRIRF
jgi:hypothetical protein